MRGDSVGLKEIDKMPASKEKFEAWMQYAKENNCLQDMPEIHDLYVRLKREGKVTLADWNEFF